MPTPILLRHEYYVRMFLRSYGFKRDACRKCGAENRPLGLLLCFKVRNRIVWRYVTYVRNVRNPNRATNG